VTFTANVFNFGEFKSRETGSSNLQLGNHHSIRFNIEIHLNYNYEIGSYGTENTLHIIIIIIIIIITKPKRLMLFRETIFVYCENLMEHINTRENQ
jgi:hypothetical protein